ncbi:MULTISPECIES: class I lanthipeptide [unclassified Sphingobacterium]|uniref:class I lanthipeptide n=1 Tax=unclassified Sphingobacterium TaxID=2609468 RepID=UPI001044210E|nr:MULTISPECIES: class I lanthipeptide [unclassified Sphingobacterium]MCS3557565.1 natural product precursor [Sphingobacterium sp. JUb21]TCQ95790.1 natural product precursor [Sphingobacterium sp. JUb20]
MKKLKKLSLDKKTIVNLDKSSLKNIQGGRGTCGSGSSDCQTTMPAGCDPGSGAPIWTVAPYATCGGCNPID